MNKRTTTKPIRWLWASITTSILGLVTILISFIYTNNLGTVSDKYGTLVTPFITIMLFALALYVVFLASFFVLGKFGKWKFILALIATTIVVLGIVQIPFLSAYGSYMTTSPQFVDQELYAMVSTVILLPAYFLFVATIAGLIEVHVTKKLHNYSAKYKEALLVTALVALLIIIL